MGFEYLTIEHKGRVTWITLNRPRTLNSLSSGMHANMQTAIDAFAQNDEQWICVITGAGNRAFCAGSDLKEAVATQFKGTYPKNGYAGLAERYDLNKPVIAAVNGAALGGGFELALSCDLIIATENAEFGLPEPLVGAVALGGGLHRLSRQIGLKKAMGYVLTSRNMSAQTAYDLGLVNEVCAQDALIKTVNQWCDDILRGAPIAIRASKETVMKGLDEPNLAAAIAAQEGYDGFQTWRAAEDTQEGPLAFSEKRKPNWKNT